MYVDRIFMVFFWNKNIKIDSLRMFPKIELYRKSEKQNSRGCKICISFKDKREKKLMNLVFVVMTITKYKKWNHAMIIIRNVIYIEVSWKNLITKMVVENMRILYKL